MDSKKSNKIREIVKLQQILKKWKKLATASSAAAVAGAATSGSNKGMKFFKRTLSFTDVVSACSDSNSVVVPKGFLAICVGEELKRFTIPTEYLSHPAFQVLLREAEEEFGFHQEGVLKIPCHVSLFEKVLKVVEDKRPMFFGEDKDGFSCYGSDCEVTPTHHAAQTCR
ncbi:auxin-responsive protein SAUR15-like [Prosopis cineraria]|uniref:auxin-responsive protein SAUR15-like n=1 Tax=Prosopis cineraria TaxID=364024 RepID=UPI002410B350|nr:auxin-responsive protein SAUR15-like [Prosopis cineraria]